MTKITKTQAKTRWAHCLPVTFKKKGLTVDQSPTYYPEKDQQPDSFKNAVIEFTHYHGQPEFYIP